MMLESMLWLNTPTFVARFLEDTVLPAVGASMTPLQVDNIDDFNVVLASQTFLGSGPAKVAVGAVADGV